MQVGCFSGEHIMKTVRAVIGIAFGFCLSHIIIQASRGYVLAMAWWVAGALVSLWAKTMADEWDRI